MDFVAHPTLYNGVNFRSRLEARWAAYFDLTHVEWQYEPADLRGWVPDFFLKFPECKTKRRRIGESSCEFSFQEAWAEVKPAMDYNELRSMQPIGMPNPEDFQNPGVIILGLNPQTILTCSMSCGGSSGGSISEFEYICGVWDGKTDHHELWKTAGNIVQWKGVRL